MRGGSGFTFPCPEVSNSSPLAVYASVLEDDNGCYFTILCEAISTDDARKRIGYVLDHTSVRILTVVKQR